MFPWALHSFERTLLSTIMSNGRAIFSLVGERRCLVSQLQMASRYFMLCCTDEEKSETIIYELPLWKMMMKSLTRRG